MTDARRLISFNNRRLLIGRTLVVSVDDAILVGVKRPVLGIELLGREGQIKTVLVWLEADGIVAPFRIYHALGKGAGVYQLGQGGGELVVLLLVELLGSQHGAHVAQGCSLRVRLRRIALELGLISRLPARCDAAHEHDRRSLHGSPPNQFSISLHQDFVSFHFSLLVSLLVSLLACYLPCLGCWPCYRRNRQPAFDCSHRPQMRLC